MDIALTKQMMDTFFLAKRIRDLLPALPDGVLPSYIHYLDAIQKLEKRGIRAKVSDISDVLNLPRPGVTRTVKEMERKGYLTKQISEEDGRITYLSLTDAGQRLSQEYDTEYFGTLSKDLKDISEEDAECTIRTIQKFYEVMCERRNSLEKR